MISKSKSIKSGFTILELALAMAFISMLLLAIGFVSVQVAVIYQKGLTIKTVNSNGRELIDELSRTILASHYDRFSDDDGEHFEYTFIERRDAVPINGEDKEVQLYGAFCTGVHSYIWNTGYALNLPENDPNYSGMKAIFIEYNENGVEVDRHEDFRLARVNDPSHEVCINYSKASDDNEFGATRASGYTEVLSQSENDLAFYNFTVFEPAFHQGSGYALFSGSFILGTVAGTIDINLTGDFCTDRPGGFRTDFVYCSVNKFNFAALATGGIAI